MGGGKGFLVMVEICYLFSTQNVYHTQKWIGAEDRRSEAFCFISPEEFLYPTPPPPIPYHLNTTRTHTDFHPLFSLLFSDRYKSHSLRGKKRDMGNGD